MPLFRQVPFALDMAEEQGWHIYEGRAALSKSPVGDAYAVTRLRVLDARFHGGTILALTRVIAGRGLAGCSTWAGEDWPRQREIEMGSSWLCRRRVLRPY